jgi:Holliday junction resolvasome RuvABC endonuclease subunit
MILALDLSSKSSGWSIFEEGELIDYGCVVSTSASNIKRIIAIREGIKEVINKYNVSDIIAEEVRTDYKNAHTYKILTWVQGVIAVAAYEINPKINITYIQPSSWRASVGIHTGRGIKREELKKADVDLVKQLYNIDVNDDIADAILIGKSYFIKNELNWK